MSNSAQQCRKECRVNHVSFVGRVTDAGPKLSYSEAGKPECRLTLMVQELGKEGQAFRLFVPVFIYGPGAEVAAADVEGGDLIAIDRRLAFKSTLKKDGSKLGLVVTAWGVEILAKAAPADRSAGPATSEPSEDSMTRPEPKARRPHGHHLGWCPDPSRPDL
jgi:single-stranded DNA-binding protein